MSLAPVVPVHPALLAVALMVLFACHARAQFETAAPEGFESLQEPQTTLVDVYFREQLLGQFLARYTPQWIAFERPDRVVAAVPNVADSKTLETALSGRLAGNAEQLCAPGEQDCGFVETDTAAVLFDRSSFQVELFVDPGLLQKPNWGPRYLEAPPNEASLVQSFAASGAGQTGSRFPAANRFNGTLRSFSLLGFGPGRLRAQTSLSEVDGFALDTAAGEYDRRNIRYLSGLYRSAPVPALGQRRIFGAGLSSTLDLRTDIDTANSTPLVVTLQRRAVVKILRDGRLLDSRVYSPGTQRLDTSGLPLGAYDVTVRIEQIGGGVRTEQRFFVKDALLPPADQPNYSLDVGVLADSASAGLPTVGSPVLHFGHLRRVGERFGIGGDLSATDAEAAAEARLLYRGGIGQLQASGIASSDRDFGVALRGFGTGETYSYSLQLRHFWSDQDVTAAPFADRNSVAELVPTQRDRTGLDLAVDYLLPEGGRIGLSGDLSRSAGADTQYSIGPEFSMPLLEDAGIDVNFDARASFGREETTAFFSLRVTWSSSRLLATTETGYRHGDDPGDSTPFVDARADYLALDGNNRQLSLGIGANRGGSDSSRANADYSGPNARADVAVDHSLTDDRATRYSGNLATTVVGNGDRVGLAGRSSNRSGVVIAVRGQSDARFDVLVDDRPVGEVSAGGDTSLTLRPYERYEVRLERRGGRFVDYDTGGRRVTVFPGTVRTLTWETAPVISIFAQATRPDGAPVANALIEGSEARLRTDADGYFQTSLGTADTLVLRPRQGAPCRIDLPDLPPETEFRDLGTLTCREIER